MLGPLAAGVSAAPLVRAGAAVRGLVQEPAHLLVILLLVPAGAGGSLHRRVVAGGRLGQVDHREPWRRIVRGRRRGRRGLRDPGLVLLTLDPLDVLAEVGEREVHAELGGGGRLELVLQQVPSEGS